LEASKGKEKVSDEEIEFDGNDFVNNVWRGNREVEYISSMTKY